MLLPRRLITPLTEGCEPGNAVISGNRMISRTRPTSRPYRSSPTTHTTSCKSEVLAGPVRLTDMCWLSTFVDDSITETARPAVVPAHTLGVGRGGRVPYACGRT